MEADKLYALKGMKAPRKTKQASSKTDAAVIATKGSKDAKESLPLSTFGPILKVHRMKDEVDIKFSIKMLKKVRFHAICSVSELCLRIGYLLMIINLRILIIVD
mgnify:CR=1 FL=1|jgi:hypothetical protein